MLNWWMVCSRRTHEWTKCSSFWYFVRCPTNQSKARNAALLLDAVIIKLFIDNVISLYTSFTSCCKLTATKHGSHQRLGAHRKGRSPRARHGGVKHGEGLPTPQYGPLVHRSLYGLLYYFALTQRKNITYNRVRVKVIIPLITKVMPLVLSIPFGSDACESCCN